MLSITKKSLNNKEDKESSLNNSQDKGAYKNISLILQKKFKITIIVII